jgi:UDP-3-O-[3-hydroxymyristoyl] N-acetylglucosamine deacetylase
MHLGLMQAIADNPDCWEYVKFKKNGNSVFKQVVVGTRSAGDKLNQLLVPSMTKTSVQQPVAV